VSEYAILSISIFQYQERIVYSLDLKFSTFVF
jgi:hypothetical protein